MLTDRAQEVLRANTHLKGILIRLFTDVFKTGLLRSNERGMEKEACVFGTSDRSLLDSTWRQGLWMALDSGIPQCGYAMNKLAQMVIDGQKVTDGHELGPSRL